MLYTTTSCPALLLSRCLQAKTAMTLQVPSQVLFDVTGGGAGGGEAGDSDVFGVNLDVQELNLVLRL